LCTFVIPALRRLRQADLKLEASLGSTVRPCLQTTTATTKPCDIGRYLNSVPEFREYTTQLIRALTVAPSFVPTCIQQEFDF
jgi:hypothetical protein